MRHKMCSN